MNPYVVLERPILSEKSTEARESGNQYTFAINLKASKKDVKVAVEKMFETKVEKVNTITARGKFRRRGRHIGQPKLTKKAIVTLVEGQRIKLFDDQ